MSLERMRGDLQDRLRDVNETWEEMENDNDGNKTSRSALPRAVRQAAKSTRSAFDQIDAFQQEWQEKIDCEKQPIAQRQTEKHPAQTPVFPSHERFDRPNSAKFDLIPEPHANQNNNTSRSSTTKKDGLTKKKCRPRSRSCQELQQAFTRT